MVNSFCFYILRRIFNLKKIRYVIFAFIPLLADSQSIVKRTNEVIYKSGSDTWDLNNYLWSYSKYEPGKTNKRILDFGTMENWRGLGPDLSVSNDGKYFAYSVVTGSFHNDEYSMYDSLVIQSTDHPMRWVFNKANPGQFTVNNKQYIFKIKDTLFFLELNSKKIKFVSKVKSYKLVVNSGNEWVVYQLNDPNSNLILKDLVSGKEVCFSRVSRYEVEKEGEWVVCYLEPDDSYKSVRNLLIYQLASGKESHYYSVEEYFYANNRNAIVLKALDTVNGSIFRKLQYVNLAEKETKTIWSANASLLNVSSCSLADDGKQVVFITEGSPSLSNTMGDKICYYKEGMDTAIVKLSSKMDGMLEGLRIQGPVSFTGNGKYIQFSMQQILASTKKKPENVQLEIRSYKDITLSFAKTTPTDRTITFKALVSTMSNQVIPLETGGKVLYKLYKDFAIVKKSGSIIHGDRFWEDGYFEDSTWLVSLEDGSQQLLPTKCGKGNSTLWISPGGKFIVYFDAMRGCHYFSYDLRTKKENLISSNVPPDELGYINHYMYKSDPRFAIGIAAWLQHDEGVLVYANHDIWLLDLTGKKKPINITNGFGQSHNIIFSLFNSERLSLNVDNIQIIDKEDILLFSSFNPINKFNGFYAKSLSEMGDPKLLNSGPYFFNKIEGCHNPNLSNDGHVPIKAKDAKIWIVQRQSASDAPNYYKTTDFKSFIRLTNFQPQAGFNWLTQELHSYQHLDGTYGQGVMYKPENFDSSKKYPVLIIFYQNFSDNLYQFRVPSLNRSVMTPGESPIWFLSNGYLVFTPDMYVAPLKYGPTAFNVIEGAVKYLKRLPFVDSNKLGCGSHSWSAKLGSYIFTHSSSFAATAISEGFLFANPLNMALSHRSGASRLEDVENQMNFGSLWQNKGFWLDETTVLNVDKAKSPLLLFCNKGSSEDYQDQTLQFFTALRRLEKTVWWLRYEKGSHTLSDQYEMRDFTIRYTQYFDHYLKEAPAPRWMTQGMAAQVNGVNGYQLDPAGSCSYSNKSKCSICDKWNQKYLKDPKMFEKPISEWKLDN